MGVAYPQLSDETSYTMVESSGAGSCRCACQEDLQDQPSSCCSPHVFTSILLGILSCVLMTGGVFLAFHKWDLMWLMVSGVGVVLIFVGTVLHCCHNIAERRMKRALNVGAKSCSARPLPTEHPGHMMINNGSLTEQLLPLSNARSVSQLSLNMLPGYFPPVMAAYGIEQHSAVVQNINRLVQQQQQQQQPSQNNGSCSPGVVSNAGKSFIVLSLPGDATAANIQNLVATVYQLDGNATETNAESNPNIPTPVSIIRPNTTVPSVLKNVEVQTCNIWPTSSATTTTAVASIASTSAENSASDRCSVVGSIEQANIHVASTISGATQANIISQISNVNLMDCSSDTASFCDTITTNICDTSSRDCDRDNDALVNIPSSSTDILNELSPNVPTISTTTDSTSILIDIPENPPSTTPSNSVLIDVNVGASNDRENLLNVSVNASDIESNCHDEDHQIPLLEELVNTVIQQVDAVSLNSNNDRIPNAPTLPESPIENSVLFTNNPDLLSGSNSNLSVTESEEIDDGELMARSSPPPSYDDVTLEGETVGAFGLAYGTI